MRARDEHTRGPVRSCSRETSIISRTISPRRCVFVIRIRILETRRTLSRVFVKTESSHLRSGVFTVPDLPPRNRETYPGR